MALDFEHFEGPFPRNHILLPARESYGGDYTIRQIRCGTCETILCGLTINDEHEAKFVWPFKVVCRGTEHALLPRTVDENANAVCYGTPAVSTFEVDSFLGDYLLPEQRLKKR